MSCAVIYTDGSARPTNPGYVGWGAHGYIYSDEEPKKPFSIDKNYCTISGYVKVTDKKKGKMVKPTHFFDFVGNHHEIGSQNIGEMLAIIKGMEKLLEHDLTEILVLTDSETTMKGINLWMKNWLRNGWKKSDGGDVLNQGLWVQIKDILTAYENRKIKVTVQWIKAHNDDLGNSQADLLAGVGAHYAIAGINHTDLFVETAKRYTEGEVERHPYIAHRRIYFSTLPSMNTPGEYGCTESGGPDTIFGKRVPEAGFSIIKLKEPDPTLELIQSKQYEVAAGTNRLMMMRLDVIFTKRVYRYLQMYGKMAFKRSKNNFNIPFVDDQSLTVESNPTFLSWRGVDNMTLLKELLERFREGDIPNKKQLAITSHDITDEFFTTTVKKIKGVDIESQELKKEIIVGYKDHIVKVPVNYQGKDIEVTIPLVFGLDILPRNNLKRIEKEHPRINLITWREAEASMRYAIVIESDLGYGIWSNFHADRIFLNAFTG